MNSLKQNMSNFTYTFSDHFIKNRKDIEIEAKNGNQTAMAICGLWELHAPVPGDKQVHMHGDCFEATVRLCNDNKITINQSKFWLDAYRFGYVTMHNNGGPSTTLPAPINPTNHSLFADDDDGW